MPNGKYLLVHCSVGVTHTKKLGDPSIYSNPVWYNHRGIANILSLRMVQKNYLVTYNSQYGNEFSIHSPHWPKLKMAKASLFYHDMRHSQNNKGVHITLNSSYSPIPQVQDKKKGLSIPIDCVQYTYNRALMTEDTSRKHHGHKIQPPL